MKKILMLSLDGVGLNTSEFGNAIKQADMTNFNKLLEEYPHAELECSGPSVGLREGLSGSEIVGYKTISAGEIIKQKSSFAHDFTDVDSLATNEVLKDAIEQVRKKKSMFHIMGLMSDGGVASNIEDVINIINYLKTQDINIGVDFIADGMDTEPKSALTYIEKIEETGVPIISICGRYYAMDQSEKWDRTRVYYDLVRAGVGLKIKEIPLALKNCYMRNITDEYLPPMLVESDNNLKDNDVVFWVNYKKSGGRQILSSLSDPESITEFQTRELKNVKVITMYPVDGCDKTISLINEEADMSNSLGQYLSKLELSQARIADKNTYQYITYYFNGESEAKIPKCNNYLIDVEESIPDKGLELNAAGITKQIIKCMEKDTDFILASFGAIEETVKTGDFEKTVDMLKFVDGCLGKIIDSAELNFYTIFLVSPFGSAEAMIDEENKPITVHTLNKVPLIITDKRIELSNGTLRDIAPTLLSYMDISIPESMKESEVLIKNKKEGLL